MYRSEVFPIPDALLTEVPVLPGLDGRKMSKSYGNCIFITEPEESIIDKISKMMTDPQRIRRNDPGDPEVSPVFAYHKLYSSPGEVADVADGCRTARIGCVECKKRLMKNVIEKLAPIREKRLQLERRADSVKEIIEAGNERARRESKATMELVRRAIGLGNQI